MRWSTELATRLDGASACLWWLAVAKGEGGGSAYCGNLFDYIWRFNLRKWFELTGVCWGTGKMSGIHTGRGMWITATLHRRDGTLLVGFLRNYLPITMGTINLRVPLLLSFQFKLNSGVQLHSAAQFRVTHHSSWSQLVNKELLDSLKRVPTWNTEPAGSRNPNPWLELFWDLSDSRAFFCGSRPTFPALFP